MLLAVPYLLAASICTNLIADGGPGWLNLLVLLFLLNTMKLLVVGPVSLALLIRARLRSVEAEGTPDLDPANPRPSAAGR